MLFGKKCCNEERIATLETEIKELNTQFRSLLYDNAAMQTTIDKLSKQLAEKKDESVINKSPDINLKPIDVKAEPIKASTRENYTVHIREPKTK